ncbi:MAG: hypothetical protein WB721_17230 [Pseudolabrys sp.]
MISSQGFVERQLRRRRLARRSLSAHVLLDEKWHNCTAEHFQKLAGPPCELLVGQFTSGMFGLESFVNGGQWVNRVAKVHAAHQRVNSGGCESPVQFCCYVAGFHLLPRFAALLPLFEISGQ